MTKEERILLEKLYARVDDVAKEVSSLSAYLAADNVRIKHLEEDIAETCQRIERIEKTVGDINAIIAKAAGATGAVLVVLNYLIQVVARAIKI